jgi:hypothetical protein
MPSPEFSLAATTQLLPESVWRDRQHAHEQRVSVWTEPHQTRASRGEKHPVLDFLFGYYAYRPSWLRRWHPGLGSTLAGESAREFLSLSAYRESPDGISVDPRALPAHRRTSMLWLHSLLKIQRERTAFFGCFGLHEWAMVYRQTPEQIRHNEWPLRFPPDELARIVESQSICCTHFDAFRFFTAPAQPLNRLQLTRIATPEHEQRGCLHANMDLYKWATKLSPYCPSELVADCFDLARRIREVDMRASPYDFADIGYPPICIETPEGRAEYEKLQRSFSAQGEPLRERLIEVCSHLLAATA